MPKGTQPIDKTHIGTILMAFAQEPTFGVLRECHEV
jgi:hypothetical protein